VSGPVIYPLSVQVADATAVLEGDRRTLTLGDLRQLAVTAMREVEHGGAWRDAGGIDPGYAEVLTDFLLYLNGVDLPSTPPPRTS
jgi:hypothetical protein